MHPNAGLRRRDNDELRISVLVACDEPGASISGVALPHGLNANLVHRWRSGRGVKLARVAIAASAPTAPLSNTPEFVAIEMPDALKPQVHAKAKLVEAGSIAEAPIQIELRRGALHLSVRWPASAASNAPSGLSMATLDRLKAPPENVTSRQGFVSSWRRSPPQKSGRVHAGS